MNEVNKKRLHYLTEQRMVIKHFRDKMVASFHNSHLNALICLANKEMGIIDEQIQELAISGKVEVKDILFLQDYPPAINLEAKR